MSIVNCDAPIPRYQPVKTLVGTNLETERPVVLGRQKDGIRFGVTLEPSVVQVLRIGAP